MINRCWVGELDLTFFDRLKLNSFLRILLLFKKRMSAPVCLRLKMPVEVSNLQISMILLHVAMMVWLGKIVFFFEIELCLLSIEVCFVSFSMFVKKLFIRKIRLELASANFGFKFLVFLHRVSTDVLYRPGVKLELFNFFSANFATDLTALGGDLTEDDLLPLK